LRPRFGNGAILTRRGDSPTRDRNFAIANVFYFFSVLLCSVDGVDSQMLQSLYGYTATDAGLVLGPGAFVIVALAPLIVKILPKLGLSHSFSRIHHFCHCHVALRQH